MTITEGIVLKERIVGEQDKFIDILTKEHGLMVISVKGARKINGKSGSSAQLFAYSRFCVDKRRDRFYLNSAEPIHIFYGLRQSVSRISLAGYFAEVLRYSTAELTDSGNVLRLFLNTLNRSLDLMKQGGVAADLKREETADALILTISIPKNSAAQQT